jgi:hypothetical protein
LKAFIEIYCDETGVMLAKVAGKDSPEATAKALTILGEAEKPGALWFIDPKTGSASKHQTAGKAKRK